MTGIREALTERDTGQLGGAVPSPEDLAAMQRGEHILHARHGEVTQIPVEKVRLPLDPQGHVQRLGLTLAPDGTVYAAQHTLFSSSTDGGRTWTHQERDPSQFDGWRLQFDGTGRMLTVRPGPPHSVWASDNEGATWEQIGELEVACAGPTEIGFSVTRLPDGTLLVPVMCREAEMAEGFSRVLAGTNTCRVYASTDGGRTFSQRSVLGDWCHEVNIAALPSGDLLAVIRYQRGYLPDDPADLGEHTGAEAFGSRFPYKHVFVADSADGGLTWTSLRQLTSVFGQCYGSGVGLSGNRVVIVHDHRYPRATASGRAMVSGDSGRGWEDEVYYLSHGEAAGYAATVSLDGEQMLTLAGSAYGDAAAAWDNAVGNTEFSLIRWRLQPS